MPQGKKTLSLLLILALFSLSLSGCGTFPGWLAASGPSRAQVMSDEESELIAGVQLVTVTDAFARKLAERKTLGRFADVFPNSTSNSHLIGPGDVLEVSVWESPPAMLFSGERSDPKTGPGSAQSVTFPPQMVAEDGRIMVPFAGRVRVKGLTANKIEAEITRRLEGRANQPQVIVRVSQNNTANVTVIGDVNKSVRMPLTPKGERVLDALAAAGGVNQAVNKMALQLSRNEKTATMALDSVIREPAQNIKLKPGDVVTALYQPRSYSVLGAAGKNAEMPLEAQGISLAQALARSGGLDDNRADARGVFVFRFEDADVAAPPLEAQKTSGGVKPVVYQVNLRDPAALFVTQNFPVQHGDVIYVTNAPSAEFQKFLRLVVAVAMPSVSMTRFLEQY